MLQTAGVRRRDVELVGKLWFWFPEEVSLRQQLTDSLTRLGHDHFDVILCEQPRPGMDVLGLAEEVAELVRLGLARAWGAMDWELHDIEHVCRELSARGLPIPQLAQLKYNVGRQNIVQSHEYDALYREYHVSLMASDVLEGGVLAGREHISRTIGHDIGDVKGELVRLMPRLVEIASDLGVTTAQLALAFAAANPVVSSVLVGATRTQQVDENVESLRIARDVGWERLNQLMSEFSIESHGAEPPYEHVTHLTDSFVA